MKDFSSTNRFLDLKDVMNNLINSFSFDIYSYEVVLSLHKEDLRRVLKEKMLHKVKLFFHTIISLFSNNCVNHVQVARKKI